MIAQCLIAVWGYYAIRSFERWTVPITALIMGVMSVLAVTQADVSFAAGTATGAGEVHRDHAAADRDRRRLGHLWLVYAADYSRFTRPATSDRRVFWVSGAGDVRPDRLAGGAGRGRGLRAARAPIRPTSC